MFGIFGNINSATKIISIHGVIIGYINTNFNRNGRLEFAGVSLGKTRNTIKCKKYNKNWE